MIFLNIKNWEYLGGFKDIEYIWWLLCCIDFFMINAILYFSFCRVNWYIYFGEVLVGR